MTIITYNLLQTPQFKKKKKYNSRIYNIHGVKPILNSPITWLIKARSAISAFSSVSVSSLLFTTAFHRNLFFSVNLARALASTHSPHKHLNYNALTTNFSCISAATADFTTDVSIPISHNSYPTYGRLLPCPSENGPPRVEHLVVIKGGPVLEYISNALDLPPLFIADLIHFGAVFYALVCPDPPLSATPEQLKAFKEFTDPSFLRTRSSIKGKTFREAQKTFRITRTDEFVEAGTYLRVHVHPKRFPRCYEIDWKSRIIAVTEDYVVLDKPAGTSVGGTTDNIEESCATFATRALGLESPLMTTHQIDNCTEGCFVSQEKMVQKLYLALAAAPVSVGLVTHYMRPVNIAPRLLSGDFIKGWHLCQLEVLECNKVSWPNKLIEEKYKVEDCGWPSQDFAYECKINLLTGKTHQIRAQLAACGAPLLGDSMYMPAAIAEANNPGLNPFRKNNIEYPSDDVIQEWIANHGKEPIVAVGLQAFKISWDDGEHSYEAGSPWWRT